MANQKEMLYRQLWNSYRDVNSAKKHPQIDSEVKLIWGRLKKCSDFPNCVHAEIVKLKQQLDIKRQGLHKFWVCVCSLKKFFTYTYSLFNFC